MKARVPDEFRGGQAGMMAKLQKMQEEMAEVQSNIEAQEFSASAGGGAVTATCNGKHELLSLKLKPEVIDPEDPDLLEDLLLAAANEALAKASDAMDAALSQSQGNFPIPGL